MEAQSGPEPGSGSQTGRPAGNVDEDANPPLTDPETADPQGGGDTNLPPQDTGSAIPPYEGRQESAKPTDEGVEGGVKPVESSSYKSPAPGETEGGATASPADEQPAAQQPESDRDYEAPGPAHTAGTRRGEGSST